MNEFAQLVRYSPLPKINFSGNIEPSTKLLSVGFAEAITLCNPLTTETPLLNVSPTSLFD